MKVIAVLVLVTVAAVSIWSLRVRPGRPALMPVFGSMSAAAYWLGVAAVGA